MVLTHTTTYNYSHPFPTVTLAFFLRYCSPQLNPFAAHVLSTDTIESRLDPETGRLHTTRIHLKKSRLPGAVFKLLPTSVTGGGGGGDKASYVLETSVVDVREGWMRTESRNLNFVGVLSVVERQIYTAPPTGADTTTGVETTVVFRSRIGDKLREKIGQATSASQQHQQSQPREASTGSSWFGMGWAAGLGTKGIQRSIESMASTKTIDQLGKSREGMRVVLERLRKSGLVNIMELTRRARDTNHNA
ncbi:hypothetical protein RB594_008202 [Gaeumannomyces avenae]